MSQKDGTIYITTNLVNGKQYVGQTIRKFEKRKNEHFSPKDCVLLYHALKKYDMDDFKWVSFSCPEEDLDWTEIFLIKELNTLTPNGYNLETGGNKNKHHHESTKEKMSIQKKEYWENLENRKKQSGRLKGKNAGEKHGMFGKGYLQIGEKNHSFGKTGEKSAVSRPVILISPLGEEYKLPCYSPFCKTKDLNYGHICEVLQGKRKQHKGWTGRYLNAS